MARGTAGDAFRNDSSSSAVCWHSCIEPRVPLPQEEVAAATHAVRELGGAPTAVRVVASYGPRGQRTAVVTGKAVPTPAKYPRTPKQVARHPL